MIFFDDAASDHAADAADDAAMIFSAPPLAYFFFRLPFSLRRH